MTSTRQYPSCFMTSNTLGQKQLETHHVLLNKPYRNTLCIINKEWLKPSAEQSKDRGEYINYLLKQK